MLDRKELDKLGPTGFNLGQKEKDYVQHWVLVYLSRSGFGGVFKGGTCLQKCFGLPRYSEDLDFTLNGAPLPDLERASIFLSSAAFAGTSWKTESTDVSETVRLRYRGPLYNGKAVSEGTIVLEFSKREKTLLEPAVVQVNPPYPDVPAYQIKTMNEAEIAAEKVRAVMTRSSARDLYDLFFLLRRGAKPSAELVNQKLAFYGIKFSRAGFSKQVKRLEKLWKTEMTALTPNPLDYAALARLVLKEME